MIKRHPVHLPSLTRGFRSSWGSSKNPYYLFDLMRSQPNDGGMEHELKQKKKEEPLTGMQKARQVFGTNTGRRLWQAEDKKPHVIAGIKVPPRPVEPDNCCMTGCINCVWEQYREKIEEWAACRLDAVRALQRQGGNWPSDVEPPSNLLNKFKVGIVGGNDALQETAEVDRAMSNVEAGFKYFMLTEKRIKERHKHRLEDLSAHHHHHPAEASSTTSTSSSSS